MKLKGYRRERDEDFKSDAELTRLQTTELINIQLAVNNRIKPEQLWKFEWDKKDEEEELVSVEEAEENVRKLIGALE
jgi:hypothetical protein